MDYKRGDVSVIGSARNFSGLVFTTFVLSIATEQGARYKRETEK